MPPGIRDIPRTWADTYIQPGDMDPAFVLPTTAIAAGGLAPSKIGVTVANKTGGTLTAGTLVYISGRDATSGFLTAAKASASAEGTLASWVVIADIANNASGTVAKAFSFSGQNTSAATVGDYVYLDTTAGGYTLTNPPPTGLLYQRVGTVSAKSATGVVVFDLVHWAMPQLLERLQGFFPTIGTTGSTESAPISIVRAGTIIGLQLTFLTALALNGTNYVTLTVNNRTQTLLLSNAVLGNSTNTGGQAITQYGNYVLTVTATGASLVVAANDKITALATVTGTLGAALGPGSWSLIMVPN